MKVLFDHQIFEEQNFGGISRYFDEILKDLDNDKRFEYDLSILYSDNIYLKDIGNKIKVLPKIIIKDSYKNFLFSSEFKGKRFIYNIWTKLFEKSTINHNYQLNKENSISKLKEGNFDIFHPTYYDDYFLDFIGNKPFVLTVHDLIHQIFPEFGMYELRDKNQNLIDKADSIVTVSENTKKDLITLFNVDEKKINVIHLANSLTENNSLITPDFDKTIPTKYLLFVGGRDIYKNFLFFVQVFASIKEYSKEVSIICTGSAFTPKELYFFEKLGVKNNLVQLSVNDDQLVFLYKNAIALIYPSMYEGFGLPVLEALALNCPVAMSHTSSLAEIGEDAVIYFNPKDPTSMKDAITSILDNKYNKIDMLEKAQKLLQKFSWNITTGKTKDVYMQFAKH